MTRTSTNASRGERQAQDGLRVQLKTKRNGQPAIPGETCRQRLPDRQTEQKSRHKQAQQR